MSAPEINTSAAPEISGAVVCPHCGSDRFQTVGYVSQWCKGTATYTPDGIDFEPGGYTDYGDDYHDTHLECADCMHEVCTLAADPYAGPPKPDAWRIFDADSEETTEEPVSERAAWHEYGRTCALNPDGRYELHGRIGGEWEVIT